MWEIPWDSIWFYRFYHLSKSVHDVILNISRAPSQDQHHFSCRNSDQFRSSMACSETTHQSHMDYKSWKRLRQLANNIKSRLLGQCWGNITSVVPSRPPTATKIFHVSAAGHTFEKAGHSPYLHVDVKGDFNLWNTCAWNMVEQCTKKPKLEQKNTSGCA